MPEENESQKTVSDAAKLIATAVAVEIQKIATAAEVAKKVIADSASEAVRVNSVQSNNDHDLIVELKTLMSGVKDDIKDLKEGTSKRISDLENNKAEKEEFEIVRKQVEILKSSKQTYFIMMSLYTAGVAIILGLILIHIFSGK